jgi:hypothetical protein
MKNIVISDEYNEIDLKPRELLQKYKALTQKDIPDLLIKNKKLSRCSCPACHASAVASTFEKFGLNYRECAKCSTLYISPRPSDSQLHQYYLRSKSRIFWRDKISVSTGKKRKEKIIKPRLEWIQESLHEYLPQAQRIGDVNTTLYGYVEELLQYQNFKQKILINPFLELDKSKLKNGIKVVESQKWEQALAGKLDIVSIFEVADRASDIDALFDKINLVLADNGLCFMTAILISGFDLQSLWDNAQNLYPPDRLNVFSVEGLRRIFQRHNLECLELSTPGILDADIVASAIEQNPKIKLPRFTRYLLKNRDEEAKKAFQEFLQANLLSSYGRILLRKR